jgi:hypothetical protein
VNDDIQIVMPSGMMGPRENDLIEAIIRAVAESHADRGEWAEKYGARVDNEVFSMHPFCWCEKDDCKYCWDESEKGPRAPNFHYKPTDFRVSWYKYIGRGMEMNREVGAYECLRIFNDCLKPATVEMLKGMLT